MLREIQVSYEKLTHQAEGTTGFPVHRAKIRFAPGPHGVVYTESFMGLLGAESVVKSFCEASGCQVPQHTE